MVRSERTTGGFFHQRVAERGESLQECPALLGSERRECLPQRLVAAVEPRAHAVFGEGVQVDDGAPPVVDVLSSPDEHVAFELRCKLAGGRQRDAEDSRELAHRLPLLGADEREHADVAPAERRLALDQLRELPGRPPAGPEPAHHTPQLMAQHAQLWRGFHLVGLCIWRRSRG
jgi:hypothetical protein